jgi:hypothetical protein
MTMTRPSPVRYLRTRATMAFPQGRLLALADGWLYVLAPDGWTSLGPDIPADVDWLSREDAEEWCVRGGWTPGLLDDVPRTY